MSFHQNKRTQFCFLFLSYLFSYIFSYSFLNDHPHLRVSPVKTCAAKCKDLSNQTTVSFRGGSLYLILFETTFYLFWLNWQSVCSQGLRQGLILNIETRLLIFSLRVSFYEYSSLNDCTHNVPNVEEVDSLGLKGPSHSEQYFTAVLYLFMVFNIGSLSFKGNVIKSHLEKISIECTIFKIILFLASIPPMENVDGIVPKYSHIVCSDLWNNRRWRKFS